MVGHIAGPSLSHVSITNNRDLSLSLSGLPLSHLHFLLLHLLHTCTYYTLALNYILALITYLLSCTSKLILLHFVQLHSYLHSYTCTTCTLTLALLTLSLLKLYTCTSYTCTPIRTFLTLLHFLHFLHSCTSHFLHLHYTLYAFMS